MEQIDFYFPELSILFLFLPLLILGEWWLYRYRKKQLQAFNSSPSLIYLLQHRSSKLQKIKTVGWISIFVLLCVACMDPFGNIRYKNFSSKKNSEHEERHAILFLVDVSASMLVPDGANGETRLETAKKIMEDVVRNSRGEMVALYAFTSALTPLVPLTLDYIFTRLSINDVEVNEGGMGGTAFEPSLREFAAQAFPHRSSLHFSVILLSDGGDNLLGTLQGKEKEKKIGDILATLPDPEAFHLHLYTIGIGSDEKRLIPGVTFRGREVYSALEPEILENLAHKGEGIYFTASQWSTWNLAREIIHQIENTAVEATYHQKKRIGMTSKNALIDLYYQIPLGIALLFYSFYLLLPDAFESQHKKKSS